MIEMSDAERSTHEPSHQSHLSCFFCLKEIETNVSKSGPKAHTEKQLQSTKVDHQFLPLKSILRYLNIEYPETQHKESERSSRFDFELCEKCGKVRDTLSELIQLGEVIEMKIGHWLEVLSRILLVQDKSPGSVSKTTGINVKHMHTVRKAILDKCRVF